MEFIDPYNDSITQEYIVRFCFFCTDGESGEMKNISGSAVAFGFWNWVEVAQRQNDCCAWTGHWTTDYSGEYPIQFSSPCARNYACQNYVSRKNSDSQKEILFQHALYADTEVQLNTIMLPGFRHPKTGSDFDLHVESWLNDCLWLFQCGTGCFYSMRSNIYLSVPQMDLEIFNETQIQRSADFKQGVLNKLLLLALQFVVSWKKGSNVIPWH